MKNFSHETPCAVKAACTVWAGAKGLQGPDLSALLFRYEYSADFFLQAVEAHPQVQRLVTGLTQNVDELLRSDTARLMLANSEFFGNAEPERHRPRGTGEAAEHLRQPAWLRHQCSRGLRADSLRGQHCSIHKFLPEGYKAL